MDESLMSANQTAKSKGPMIIIGIAVILVAVVLILWQQNRTANPQASPEANISAEEPAQNNGQMPALDNQGEPEILPQEQAASNLNQENQAIQPNSQPEVKIFTVKGKNFSFDPAEIRVQRGDKVKIVFQNESGYHDWVLEGYNVRTKQMTGPATETIEFTADKTGIFEYYCSVGTHRANGMKGNLIVE